MGTVRERKAIVIGSGIGGLSCAIRLAARGYTVEVFEKNRYPGGKLSEFSRSGYRFDKGPSLFTMPELVLELGTLGKNPKPFHFHKLEAITTYFYEDGTKVTAWSDKKKFAEELHRQLNEPEKNTLAHLDTARYYYETTAGLFIEQSISKWRNFLNLKTLKGILRSPNLGLFKNMDQHNRKRFRNPKTVQLFNRYATYNGSDPYRAPALLNQIPYLEMGLGAYLPEKGMHQITEYLVETAKLNGVLFHFGKAVDKISHHNGKVNGIVSQNEFHSSDLVVSDIDIHPLYHHLLNDVPPPKRILDQEKSSSAFVFYWGIRKQFPDLGLHNILFSENYRSEFNALFGNSKPYDDPTIYINITSKYCVNDAPPGCENWFVMVNVPHNKDGKTIDYAKELRSKVIQKINRVLKTDIEHYIETEDTLDPMGIELQTSSYGGSLYGNASNSSFSAFRRHANYSSTLGGLYLVGGSVHPGGGIPLCLWSGKIVDHLIRESE